MNKDHTMMSRSAKYLQLFVACLVTALSAGILFGWQAAVIMLQQGGAITLGLWSTLLGPVCSKLEYVVLTWSMIVRILVI